MSDEGRRAFSEIMDFDPGEREAYFLAHRIPREIRVEVEQLLRFDTEGSDLQGLVADSITDLLEGLPLDDRCGPFRLLRLIGSGGMGSVYLAERADGEVEHRAAVKLLHVSANSSDFMERFLRERQILARLDHPSIARLLDAGRTTAGQPYLAMDYVDGVPVDQYAKNLDWRETVRLFLEICDAVSYAHRSLIVHRDLKPSNILVDAEGRPKLLDFGIAKILDSDPAAEQTAAGLMPMTPQYASPEQVTGEPITTASDVYSLGVVLYKMLTGRLPYDVTTLNPAAVARTVCETQPAAPQVTADLDDILMMALRKEPARRYLYVQHLADDLNRALSDRPVLARPDTIIYRATKFVRRNRLSVGVAAVGVLAVASAALVAIGEERVAQRRFQDVRKLAHTFVFELDDQIANIAGTTKARETIVTTGLAYLDNLAKNASGDLTLQDEIALGRTSDALVSYEKAGAIFKAIAAADAVYLPELAEYYNRRAFLILRTGDTGKARENSKLAIDAFARARAIRPLSGAMEQNYAFSFCILADIDEDAGHAREAWNDASRCADSARTLLKNTRTPALIRMLAQADERMGTAAQNLGRLTEGLRALAEQESLLNELLGAEPRNSFLHRSRAVLYQFRSSIYLDDEHPNLGDAPAALQSARMYLAAAEEMRQSDPNNKGAQYSRAVATFRVAFALAESDPNTAIPMTREAVQTIDALIASDHKNNVAIRGRFTALRHLSTAQFKAGRFSDARVSAATALTSQRPRAEAESGPDLEERRRLVEILVLQSRIEAAAGNFTDSQSLLKEARERVLPFATTGELNELMTLADTERAQGESWARQGKASDARASYQRVADIWERYPDPNEYVDRQKEAAASLLASLHTK
jgi:eukaryotic-like serine/threonine-protein kinase